MSELGIADASIIVGTSCAGTGTDIQDVTHVVIVGLPYSIEQLLQWAGRCRCDNGTVHVLVTQYGLKEDTELSGRGFIILRYVTSLM
jgi:superfamily II DNA/RNA helicase